MFVILAKLMIGFLATASTALEIQVEGSINPGSADYILEAIQLAEAKPYVGLIIKMNTPGGLLSTTRDIIQGINQSKVPVILYVTPSGGSATSAGALIALSAHYVAMNPGTNIGAAHPVGPGGESPKGAMADKAVQDTAAMARSQAQQRGRNVELAEKVVTESLSFTAEEALKKKLIDFVVDSDQALLAALQGKVQIDQVEFRAMNLKQRFLHLIADPNLSTLLLSLAGIAIYTEISSGFSLIAPGVVGLLMLILGFVSLQMLPITTGGAILMAVGLILLVAEVFVTSFGLLAIAGLGALYVGSLFLVDSSQLATGVSPQIIGSILLSVSSIIAIFGYFVWKEGQVKVKSGVESLIGQTAVVQSVHSLFRGTIMINGEIWNCVGQSELSVGQTVTLKEFAIDHFVVN